MYHSKTTYHITVFAIILIGFPLFLVGQNNEKHLRKEIKKIINFETDIDLDDYPSYIIGVKIQDSVYTFSFGNNIKAESDHIFEIGGLTKSFTSLLTGLIVQSEQLHPDSSVNHYLPTEYKNEALQHISVLDLVKHTSRLPRLPRGIGLKEKDRSNPFGHYTKTDLLTFYKNYSPAPNINQKREYTYSHTNYALLEIVLENATGKSYETLLQNHIFEPHDMFQAGVDDFSDKNRKKIIQGYTLGGQPTGYWKMASFAGSEGIKASMNDLLKYLDINVNTEDKALIPILMANHTPETFTGLSKTTFAGHGWHIMKNKRYYNMIFHAGKTTGYKSFMGFVPETETGVVVLSNSPVSSNGLGMLILKMINNDWRQKRGVFKVKG